jgi:hypothetical protein
LAALSLGFESKHLVRNFRLADRYNRPTLKNESELELHGRITGCPCTLLFQGYVFFLLVDFVNGAQNARYHL